ncbi:MAG: 50S ribosomal protein L24 [Spirochaetales bacterium]|jgi:large subunit ribosomal protein L24|nr:50S ribosomal protein L24 [Spirochaetales bacterium]
MKLKKDDTVQVISGKDRGKTGKVIRIDHDKSRVIIQGLNLVKKAKKPRNQNEKGGIIDIEAPLNVSKVMILCKKCGPTRAGYRIEGTGKIRICRKCGEAL